MFDWRSRESLLIGARLGADRLTSKDTNLRAIGERAHIVYSVKFFSSQCVLASTAGCVTTL